MKHPTPTIIALIIINVLVFAATWLVPGQQAPMIDLLALHYPNHEDFRIWQYLTHMFMHGSPAHILFNMLALYMFGGVLERLWGVRRFLVFYFVAGIGAGLIYTSVNMLEFQSIYRDLVETGVSEGAIQSFLQTEQPLRALTAEVSAEKQVDFHQLFNGTVVGASGAIYGVLVAFALLFPNAKLALIFFPVPVAAKYFVPVLLLIDLFSGVTGFSLFGGGIAHFAHIGGAIIGFALMLYWRMTLPRRRQPEDPQSFGPDH